MPRSVRSEESLAGGAVRPGESGEVSKAPGSKSRTGTDLAHTILRKDLRLHPYRMQVRHKLTPEDKSRRVKMVQWFAEHLAVLDRL